MIHKVEAFEKGEYLRELIARTPFLQERTPESLSLLWRRVLNNTEACVRLKRNNFPPHDIQNARSYLLAASDLAAKTEELF